MNVYDCLELSACAEVHQRSAFFAFRVLFRLDHPVHQSPDLGRACVATAIIWARYWQMYHEYMASLPSDWSSNNALKDAA